MTQKMDGVEQAALNLLERAKAFHPLVKIWVHRITGDTGHTDGLPAYEDVAAQEWTDASVTPEQGRFGVAGSRLTYPLPNDYASEANERTREHWEEIDSATMLLCSAIVLHRQGDEHLPRDIERFHDMVLRVEHFYSRDMHKIRRAEG